MSHSEQDIVLIEKARVAHTNAANPEIAAELAEVGFDAATMADGKAVLDAAVSAYDDNQREDNETRNSYAAFIAKYEEVQKLYRADRKKARVVFRNDPVTLQNLGITGTIPHAYVTYVETVETFYSVANDTVEIQTTLAKLKVTIEDLVAGLAKVQELKEARSLYLLEKGESQQATINKDTAIAKLCKWMRDFRDVAKLALEEKPQLLESLGIHVRS